MGICGGGFLQPARASQVEASATSFFLIQPSLSCSLVFNMLTYPGLLLAVGEDAHCTTSGGTIHIHRTMALHGYNNFLTDGHKSVLRNKHLSRSGPESPFGLEVGSPISLWLFMSRSLCLQCPFFYSLAQILFLLQRPFAIAPLLSNLPEQGLLALSWQK